MSQIYKLLLDKINNNKTLIEDWFFAKFQNNRPLFSNSVDLRHSGFKIAPVDNNCFPAGFNNLGNLSKEEAKKAVLEFLKQYYPNAKKILIIPENHTRNLKYLENIVVIKEVIESNNIAVEFGSLIPEIDDILKVDLENGANLILHKIVRNDDRILTKSGFEPDLIVSNNDFTNPPEDFLLNIKQDIVPTLNVGWYNRKKSNHFAIYKELAVEIAGILDFDPWLIDSIYKNVSGVDFKNKANIENLAAFVQNVLDETKEKYQQYHIKSDPYCFIKADNGTYGMGILTVKNAAEIIEINKKQRNKMNVIKGNVVNDKLIIQEGIPTIDRINGNFAEPMIYLLNGKVVGNLSRINSSRDQNISLNAAGMEFVDMANLTEDKLEIGGSKKDIFQIYSLIARLSALAATQESY